MTSQRHWMRPAFQTPRKRVQTLAALQRDIYPLCERFHRDLMTDEEQSRFDQMLIEACRGGDLQVSLHEYTFRCQYLTS